MKSRLMIGLALLCAALTAPPAMAAERNYQQNASEGDAKAPLHMIIYFNPLNDHTPQHWLNVRQPLLQNYVSKGVVSIEYRELFHGDNDYIVDTFLRCVPLAHYQTAVALILGAQKSLKETDGATAQKLTVIGRQMGLDLPAVGKCMVQPEMQTYLKKQREDAINLYDVAHSPNYILVGKPYRFSSHATYENIDAGLKALLHPQ